MKLIKKFTLITITFLFTIPSFAHGMDNQRSKRRRDESSEKAIVPAKRTKSNEFHAREQAVKIKISIQKNITQNKPSTIIRFLLIPHALKLTDEERKDLYRDALRSCNQMQINSQEDSQLTGINEETKTQYKNAKEIIVILGAFYHLKNHKFPKALFTPRPYFRLTPSLDNALEYLIMNEKKQVSACCFRFTLFNIAKALVKQSKNKISVELVTDQGDNSPIQAIAYLIINGIPVFSPRSEKYEMNHHKFLIFKDNISGKSLVWKGSYNLTGNANKNAWEDVTILDDSNIVKLYEDRFKEIKEKSQSITDKKIQKSSILQEKTKTKGQKEYSYNMNSIPQKWRSSDWFEQMKKHYK